MWDVYLGSKVRSLGMAPTLAEGATLMSRQKVAGGGGVIITYNKTAVGGAAESRAVYGTKIYNGIRRGHCYNGPPFIFCLVKQVHIQSSATAQI